MVLEAINNKSDVMLLHVLEAGLKINKDVYNGCFYDCF